VALPVIATPNGQSARSRAGLGGFTLIELLVVVAVIVIAVAIVAPSVGRLTQKPQTPVGANQFVDILARLRDRAATQRVNFRGFVNFDTRRLEDAGGQVFFQFPDDTEIVPTDPTIFALANAGMDNPADQSKRLACVFRSDGSGCPLDLRWTDTASQWQILVDPVTGRVRLRRFGAVAAAE